VVQVLRRLTVKVPFSAGVVSFCHGKNLWLRKIDDNDLQGILKEAMVT
jgi:hypothetical protein